MAPEHAGPMVVELHLIKGTPYKNHNVSACLAIPSQLPREYIERGYVSTLYDSYSTPTAITRCIACVALPSERH